MGGRGPCHSNFRLADIFSHLSMPIISTHHASAFLIRLCAGNPSLFFLTMMGARSHAPMRPRLWVLKWGNHSLNGSL